MLHPLRFALALVTVALLLPAGEARPQATDAAVKAAFLPRFARYVEWPAAALPGGDAPFVLCVAGADPFGQALERSARAQSVDGHRITVRRLGAAARFDGCHIAYIHGSRSQPAGQMLAAIGNRPVLTVTDAANGGQRGIIHFAERSGRVGFFIDEAGAKRRGMGISSRLLALAIEVRQR